MTQAGQILRVLDTRTSGFRQPAQKTGTGSGELVATDEAPVGAESLFDTIVMEDSEGNGCLSNSTGTDEGDGG